MKLMGRFGRVAMLLAGATLDQVAVTACGGTTARALAAGDGGGGAGGGEATEPEVRVVACAPFNGGNTRIAGVDFPGRSVDDLTANLSASATLAPGYLLFGDPSWTTVKVSTFGLKDGGALVVCNGEGPQYAVVTFVLR